MNDVSHDPAVSERAGADVCRQSAQLLAASIARRERSALEVVDAHIARIEAVNPSLNAVIWRRYDAAREEAREVDRRRAAGQQLGPLAGVPITIKECLDLAGSPSSFGLPAWRSRIAERDETHVARLRAAGAIVLGKTNVAQCLLFFETDNPVYGRTNHPRVAERTPGGSSGGQAAIIASGGSPLGLGTDIGGSGRLPAAYCGIVGFKATAGRMIDQGVGSVPIGQRAIVSQVSVFGRTVSDAALALEITADREHTPVLRDHREVDVSGLRIGFFDDDGVFTPAAACRRAVAESVARLRARGAEVIEIQPPDLRLAYELFYRVMSADRSAGLSRLLGKGARTPQLKQIEQIAHTPDALLPLIKGLLRMSGRGKTVEALNFFGPYTADAYFKTCERQLDYQARWQTLLSDLRLDAVVSPATALPAIRHGASVELGIMGSYTCLYNVLGWPAGVVPITEVRADEETRTSRGADVSDRVAAESERGSAGLPIAVQVAGAPWREDRVLAVMNALHVPQP